MERFEIESAYPSFAILSDPDFRIRIEKEASRLQGEAVRRGLVSLGRGIRALFRGAFRLLGMIAEGTATMRLYEELNSLDDAGLAERGITREEISRYVLASMDRTAKMAPAEAGLSAIDGGRREAPAQANESLPHRRAA